MDITWLDPVAPRTTSPEQVCEVGSGTLVLHTPLHDRVLATKNEIDRIAPGGAWDDAKKITNPYEYIFLSLQRRMHRSIAATVPLSRSYFKMVEIWDALGLRAADIQRTSHSAEGPGGFLEAIQMRTAHRTRMIAMTLRSTEHTIPGWRKSQAFLARNPTVQITYGADGTGDLYRLENQDAFDAAAREHLGGSGADLYTADGGFDFSADFNGQENTVQRLLVAEALAGLQTLRPGGTMVIKMFDTKHRATVELVWILANCFTRTGFLKPRTSRPANSERYWVGVDFVAPPAWIPALLRRLTDTDAPAGWNRLFAVPPYDDAWMAPIQAFQERIEEQQLHTIEMTLNLIRSPSRAQIAELLLTNIRQSRQWCLEHGVPLNGRYAELRDEQITALNLEEVLGPFPALAGRTHSRGLSPHEPMHRASSSVRPQLPPAAPAWRSALPASVLGRSPSQTTSETQPSEEQSMRRPRSASP